VNLCRRAGASEYVSGPAAKPYLDEAAFSSAGVTVSWFDYGPYPDYEQVHPPFDPHVSILDLLFNLGERAPNFVRRETSLAS
jgi:hypothetical protein